MRRKTVGLDLIAGVSLAAFVIPESLAYTSLARLLGAVVVLSGVTRRMLWARPSIPLFDRYQNRCHNDSVSYGHGEYLRPHRVLVSW